MDRQSRYTPYIWIVIAQPFTNSYFVQSHSEDTQIKKYISVFSYFLHPILKGSRPGMTFWSPLLWRIGCIDWTAYFCFDVLHHPMFVIIYQQFLDTNRNPWVHWGSGLRSKTLGPISCFTITANMQNLRAQGYRLQVNTDHSKAEGIGQRIWQYYWFRK